MKKAIHGRFGREVMPPQNSNLKRSDELNTALSECIFKSVHFQPALKQPKNASFPAEKNLGVLDRQTDRQRMDRYLNRR